MLNDGRDISLSVIYIIFYKEFMFIKLLLMYIIKINYLNYYWCNIIKINYGQES